MTTTCLAN